MALGGGVFQTQNKKLPGAYINFVSVSRATASLSDRGFAAMPLLLDWGPDGEVFTVTRADFIRNCQKYFGYDYIAEEMKGLRDLFLNATTLYCYRLNSGAKAQNDYATAKYSGARGNDIKIVIAESVDYEGQWEVKTYLGTALVDSQVVANAAGLQANDFVEFKASAVLAQTAGTPLAGGSNAEGVAGSAWQAALSALEKYSFNVLGCVSTNETVKDLCIEYTKRMRDEVGVKFQCVVHNRAAADSEACISVKNNLVGETDGNASAAAVYFVTGAEAGCKVNKSCTNKVYNGYFEINTNYTQAQLEDAISAGELVFHQVGEDVRVLTDVNTLVTTTDEKGEDFKSNQVIRVLDQIANDIAVLFNTKYLGIYPNNTAGRVSLWNDIAKHHQELEALQAIEGYAPEDTVVEQGNSKKAVVVTETITPVVAMEQLYMTVTVA